MAEEEQRSAGLVRRGDPDPSLLTTSALLREIGTLKEQLQESLAAQVAILNTRIAGIEAGIQKASEDYTRVPTLLDREMTQIRVLVDERFKQIGVETDGQLALNKEKFAGIDRSFDERDTRTEQIAKLSETAINAALAAAKEAAGKSELQFTKLMEQLQDLLSANTRALDDKVTDVKERVTRIEASGLGMREMRQEGHSSNSFIIAVLVAIMSFIGLVVTLISRFTTH